LAYDVFIGKGFALNDKNLVKTEVRVQYWHYIRDLGEGLFEVIPSMTHEYKLNSKVTTYERLALQWNNELAPFGELLSGQAGVGLKVKLGQNLTWNLVDVTAVTALTPVDDGDPREGESVKAAVSTALTLGY